jgi:hypothetical protein
MVCQASPRPNGRNQTEFGQVSIRKDLDFRIKYFSSLMGYDSKEIRIFYVHFFKFLKIKTLVEGVLAKNFNRSFMLPHFSPYKLKFFYNP